jgi:hypothetical protein
VLVDPQRWFGTEFVAKAETTSDENEYAISAAIEQAQVAVDKNYGVTNG